MKHKFRISPRFVEWSGRWYAKVFGPDQSELAFTHPHPTADAAKAEAREWITRYGAQVLAGKDTPSSLPERSS